MEICKWQQKVFSDEAIRKTRRRWSKCCSLVRFLPIVQCSMFNSKEHSHFHHMVNHGHLYIFSTWLINLLSTHSLRKLKLRAHSRFLTIEFATHNLHLSCDRFVIELYIRLSVQIAYLSTIIGHAKIKPICIHSSTWYTILHNLPGFNFTVQMQSHLAFSCIYSMQIRHLFSQKKKKKDFINFVFNFKLGAQFRKQRETLWCRSDVLIDDMLPRKLCIRLIGSLHVNTTFYLFLFVV